MSIGIRLNSPDAVARINKWACKQKFETYLNGDGNISVNAKSYLGMFALIGKDVNLTIPDHVAQDEALKALKDLF